MTFDAEVSVDIPVRVDDTAFVYVYEGSVAVGTDTLAAGTLGVVSPGNSVTVSASAPVRLLLIAARPLREPFAKRGPLVISTSAEIQTAFDDCRAGRMG